MAVEYDADGKGNKVRGRRIAQRRRMHTTVIGFRERICPVSSAHTARKGVAATHMPNGSGVQNRTTPHMLHRVKTLLRQTDARPSWKDLSADNGKSAKVVPV